MLLSVCFNFLNIIKIYPAYIIKRGEKMKDNIYDRDTFMLSELRLMEVIDIADGKRLGFIGDIIYDDSLKKIDSIVIPPQGSILSLFKKKDEIRIKWNQIKVIGSDVIIVDTSTSKKDINEADDSVDMEEKQY